MKFRRATVVLTEERYGRKLTVSATPFTINGYCEPRSGFFLDVVVQYGDTKVKRSATVMKLYSFTDRKDAEESAWVEISEFLCMLASITESIYTPPEFDRNSEWRASVQGKALRVAHGAQERRFALDVLEWAEELGEFCGLLRFVYLYFLAGVHHCYAHRLRTIADQLLDERKTAKGRKLEMTL
jgi:hypothetical protein